MSFRKPFERRNRSSVRRASRALSRHLVPACVESLEERTLLSAVLPGLDDHGVIITNAQVAGQSQVIVDSRQNSDLSGNAGGSGLFINLNNAASVKTIRISEVTVSGNGNAGVQIRLANMTLDRLEIDRAVISGNGGAGLVIDLTNANIGQLIIHDSTNPTDPTQPNAPNSGVSRIANNAFDGICVVARGVGVVSTIGTLRLNGNVVENNAGNGVLFNLNAVNVTNLDLFDNEVRTNTGNGVHFETNRTNLTGSVVRNTFTGNSAGTTTAGHGLSFFSQSLIGSTPSPAPSNFDFTAFSDNVFSNNAGAGVSVDLRTQTTWDATLLRNTFSGNQRLGFDLRAVDTLNAFDVKFGDIAVNPRLQLVNGNTFTNNVGAAIALDLNDASGNAGNTTGRFVILGNTITGTSALAGSTIYRGEGINIRARGSVALVNGAARYFGSTIDRNTILGNAGDGVRLTVSEDSELIDLLIGNNIDADGDGNVDRTFDVNGPDNFGGGDVLTRQGDGNVISGNGGNGISVIRLGSAYVQNARILDNRITNNAEGVYLQASNTYITVPNAARFGLTATGVRTGVPTVNDFTVNNNDLSNNRANGVHLRTEANAVILADLRYNRIDSNAANGIRLTGLENVASDFENIGGTWVKNAITNNGQNGIAIENVVGSVNPLRIGLDGRDRADDQSLGNFIALNGEDGIEIGARPGIAGSQTPRDVRDGAEIVNNLIVDNGRNAVGNPHAAGKGIDVEVLITSHREFRIDRNVIQGNAGDGIELRNAGGLLRVSALGNFIDLNGGRGVDLLNQLGFINYNAEAFVRFGDAGTTTLLDGSTFTNRNIITNNGQEGFYVVNTPTREQTQDVPAENVLLQTSEDALEGLPVNLVLDLENNEIRDNGLGVPQLNSPGSRLTGTGLVIRVGTQVSSGSPFVAPDTSGNSFYFSSTDGAGFFTSPAAAGVGSNVIQGAGTVAIDTNDSGGVRVSGNGRVNARVVDNEFSGNVGDDVLMESFTALTPDTTAGAWSPTEFRIDSYDRDPLARLNLVFTGNKGDSIDVVRGWFTPEPTGSYTPGARFNNAEGDFKSRT
ncbi:MAG TPA: right-handed parallel beta-helix repeat-containing protein, partial [Planctomycetaceae bacterium]